MVLIGSEGESPCHCSPVLYLPQDNPFRCLELALMSPSHLALPGCLWSPQPCSMMSPCVHYPRPGCPLPNLPHSTTVPTERGVQNGTQLSADIWPVLHPYPGCHAVNPPVVATSVCWLIFTLPKPKSVSHRFLTESLPLLIPLVF